MEKHTDQEPKYTLPIDIFENRFSWACNQVFRHYQPILVTSLLIVASVALLESPKLWDDFPVASLTGFVISIIGIFQFIPTWFLVKRRRVLSKNGTTFGSLFLAVNPGVDAAKWAELAYKMNQALYEQGHWRTALFFYSGRGCQTAFRKHILGSRTPDVPREASERYQQDIDDLFKHYLQKQPPMKSLPEELKPKCFTTIDLSRVVYMASVVGFTVFGYILSKSNFWKVFWVFFPFCVTRKISRAYYSMKYHHLDVTQRLVFLATILYFSPGKDMKRWDLVARNMDQYLREEGLLLNPQENFFNSRECLKLYKFEFRPLASRKEHSRYGELKNIVREVNPHAGF